MSSIATIGAGTTCAACALGMAAFSARKQYISLLEALGPIVAVILWKDQLGCAYTSFIDNEAAIAMTTCNKDTAGNRHVARRYHYVRQGTNLKEHTFHWIGTKNQLADVMTKEGGPSKFKNLWDVFLVDMEIFQDDQIQ